MKTPNSDKGNVESSQNSGSTIQKHPAVNLQETEVRFLRSKIVENMEYKLYISLPENYNSSTDSYPVLYYLDAWAQFGIICQAYWLLRMPNEVPPLIIVGIAHEGNTKDFIHYRARDYTPTYVSPELMGEIGAITPVSGGAPDFAEFCEHELFPFIENEYKADKTDRAIFGSSYAGLFSTYALIKHTNLFQRYFIGSPPLWWDDEIIFEYEDEYARDNESLPAKVFLSAGEKENLAAYHNLRNRILSRKYHDLEFTSTIFQNETHMSVIPASNSRALRVLYSGA
jgi:predicted alpha/beta superfamily hydrolase